MEISYQGVNFTTEQNNLLNNDLALIDTLNQELKDLNAQVQNLNNGIANNNNNIVACTTTYGAGTQKENQCIGPYQDAGNWLTSQINNLVNGSIPQKQEQIRQAGFNYNSDLTAVQNAIKLGIQASVANSTSSAQAAQNQVSILQNNPSVLAEKLKTQALIDSQKREQNVKIVGFILLAAVVVLIGWYVIKKLL